MDGRGNANDMSRRAGELWRRVNRYAEGPMTRRKIVVIGLFLTFLFLYVGPGIMNWLYSDGYKSQRIGVCQRSFLDPFQSALSDKDVFIRQESTRTSNEGANYVPYVGNGWLGLGLEHDSHLSIKYGRTLSLPLQYNPLYSVNDYEMKEFTVVEYQKGIVHRFQCSESGFQVSYQYYAHRTIPSLFVQEIWLNNLSSQDRQVKLTMPRLSDLNSYSSKTVKLHQGVDAKDYEVVTGKVSIPDSDLVIAVAIVCRQIRHSINIGRKDGVDLLVLTTVQYSDPIKLSEYTKQVSIVEMRALTNMENAIALTGDTTAVRKLKENHARVWQSLWYTGFYISESKAEGVINGDRINATIYALLSQVRSYEHEENIKLTRRSEIMKSLTYSEGCYEGHSTLEAINLWKPLNTVEDILNVASVWLLTLEKQGCHNLLKAGASGVNQAVVLSLGSLRFSNQHLEYNIHPKKLHRDFLFRRVNYGNMTHVNISVVLQEDNKAAIFVALDRSDKKYYACDAGCLDDPVQLGPYRKYFPVKLTEPLTAILYITADKQHMEDLRHAIHVSEVVEAPAHEHHVIALHKHGHSLGGVNPLFWVSIIVLIVVFHLFLFRLIINEFCDSGFTYRRLYNKRESC